MDRRNADSIFLLPKFEKYPQKFPVEQNTVVCTVGIQEYTVINHSADKHKSGPVIVVTATETHCHGEDSNLIPECAKHDWVEAHYEQER